MQDLPHLYTVSATAKPDVNVRLSAAGLPDLETAGPPEFGGPGDVWSPETLLVGAVADCYILSFRAIARASDFEWISLRCDVDAVLEKIEKVTQFTEIRETVVLEVPAGSDEAKAMRLLERAKRICLITNSMTGTTQLDATVRVVD